MIRAPHLILLESPLVDTQSLRHALIERMANDLLAAGVIDSEAASMRTLRRLGYTAADIIMCIDDARQVAMQDIVAREMAKL
jgi:hypothetical protein